MDLLEDLKNLVSIYEKLPLRGAPGEFETGDRRQRRSGFSDDR